MELTKPKICLYQRMYDVLRKNKNKGPINRYFIADALNLLPDEIDNNYLKKLTDAEFVKKYPTRPTKWELIKDVGMTAPRFTHKGELITKCGANEAIWKAMRILKSFTLRELSAHVEEYASIGIEDNQAGLAATGTVTLTGTATSIGVATVVIGGKSYQTAINVGDTAKSVADRLIPIINVPDTLVTATNKDGAITLTAKNKGAIGNEIAISATVTASDLTVAVTNMAGGDVNGDIGPALDAVAGKRYHIICSALNDDTNNKKLSNHVTSVSNAIEKRGCIGVIGWRGTLATGTSVASKLNDGRVSMAWYKMQLNPMPLLPQGMPPYWLLKKTQPNH